ncbi:MAG: hypothetical protein UY48_C0003G0086 [Candidatus Gottesmanbacteria bacterium GW2011_GWB1_49_7]|uniref:Uncharacterized protein n=1 Tax=Candidatus Gottesmanbacteria bacterium GW2011_GWB1_49_7 TaxID=1618448 RepID=A0A0G1Z3B2_9BACT|nr:MAG: hypothetical protein UY48_C0003G0086 [Candidatus Gottesmanbacteria bacterium GW2011_GWB1_49_7]
MEVHVHPPGARLFRDANRDPVWLYHQARLGTLKVAPIAVGICPDRPPDPVHAQIGKLPVKYFRDHAPRFIWHPAKRRFHSVGTPPSWLFDPGWDDQGLADVRVRRWLENRVFDVATETSALQELFSWARYFHKARGVLLVPDHIKAKEAISEWVKNLNDQWYCKTPFSLMYPKRRRINTKFKPISLLQDNDIFQFDRDRVPYWMHCRVAWEAQRDHNLSLFIVPSFQAAITANLKEFQVFLNHPLDFVAQIGPCTNAAAQSLYRKVKRNTSAYWKLGWTKADTLYQRMAQYDPRLGGKEFLKQLVKLYNL